MQSDPAAPRAVSPVVGVVVLVGMVVASATIVVVVGGGMLGSLQDEASTEQASASMESVATKLEGSGQTVVHAPEGGQAYVDPDAGRMEISVGSDTVIDERLGAVYYEVDDTRLAYQGGGVWRRDGRQRATMHSTPPIQYAGSEEPTMIFPVVTIADEETVDGSIHGESLRTVETEHVFPQTDGETFNPVANETVEIRIESEFYEAWGEYFETVLGLDVDYDHGAEAVGAELEGADIYDPDVPDPDDGMTGFAFNEGTELDVANNVTVDSYDSTDGPYPATGGRHAGHVKSRSSSIELSNEVTIYGNVDVTGEADFSGDVTVYGDVRVGQSGNDTNVAGDFHGHGEFSTKEALDVWGDVTFEDDVIVGDDLLAYKAVTHGDLYVYGDAPSGEGEIHGDVYVNGTQDVNASWSSITVHGDIYEGVPESAMPDPRDPDVDLDAPDVDVAQRVNELEADNDNAGPDDLDAGSSPTLQNCGSTCELGPGEYYVENLSLQNGDRLLLNATEGPIDLGVGGQVTVDDASIEVAYDPDDEHAATLYVEDDFEHKQGSTVEIDGDRSPVFEVFMAHDTTWTIVGDSEFRGVLYGMEDGGQRTTVNLRGDQNSQFYGAILGDIDDFDKDQEFHRDEALGYGRLHEYDPEALEDDGPRLIVEDGTIAYLHVEHRTVESD